MLRDDLLSPRQPVAPASGDYGRLAERNAQLLTTGLDTFSHSIYSRPWQEVLACPQRGTHETSQEI